MEGTQSSAPPPNHTGEEGGFIDMEVIPSCANLLKIRLSNTSPPATRDFKFQMSSYSSSLYSSYHHLKVENNREAPPQILINTTTTTSKSFTAPPTISNTPFDSCDISPIESRRVSCELNPTDYQYNFLEWSTEALSAFINCSGGGVANGQHSSDEAIKSSWRKKLRMMIHSSSPRNLTHKLTDYFKSLHLISKPAACSVDVGATNLCSNKTAPEKSGTEPCGNGDASAISTKAKEYVDRYIIKNQQLPINKWRSPHRRRRQGEKQAATSFIMKSMDEDNQTTFACHRRSFSVTTTKRPRRTSSKCYYSTSSSSSSLMSNSNSSSNCSSFKSNGNGFHHEMKRTVDLEEESKAQYH